MHLSPLYFMVEVPHVLSCWLSFRLKPDSPSRGNPLHTLEIPNLVIPWLDHQFNTLICPNHKAVPQWDNLPWVPSHLHRLPLSLGIWIRLMQIPSSQRCRHLMLWLSARDAVKSRHYMAVWRCQELLVSTWGHAPRGYVLPWHDRHPWLWVRASNGLPAQVTRPFEYPYSPTPLLDTTEGGFGSFVRTVKYIYFLTCD